MIEASVLAIEPHPDQKTNNPGCWAIQLRVKHDGKARTFWRWYIVREWNKNHFYVTPSNAKKPTTDEILAQFWKDTFGELHGFNFEGELCGE